jgi:hypothetical protein
MNEEIKGHKYCWVDLFFVHCCCELGDRDHVVGSVNPVQCTVLNSALVQSFLSF